MSATSPSIHIPEWSVQPPDLYKTYATAGIGSPISWRIEDQNQQIYVTQTENKQSLTQTSRQFEFEDGIFIGSNQGEWGGELVFMPKDVEHEQPYRVCEGNIIDVKQFQEKIYVLSGLAHLASGWGKVTVLVKKYHDRKKRWTVSQQVNLEQYTNSHDPNYIEGYAPKKLVITARGIYVLIHDWLLYIGHATMTVEKVHSLGLIPSKASLYIWADRLVLLGMSYGVWAYDLTTDWGQLWVPQCLSLILQQAAEKLPKIERVHKNGIWRRWDQWDEIDLQRFANAPLKNSYPITIGLKP